MRHKFNASCYRTCEGSGLGVSAVTSGAGVASGDAGSDVDVGVEGRGSPRAKADTSFPNGRPARSGCAESASRAACAGGIRFVAGAVIEPDMAGWIFMRASIESAVGTANSVPKISPCFQIGQVHRA